MAQQPAAIVEPQSDSQNAASAFTSRRTDLLARLRLDRFATLGFFAVFYAIIAASQGAKFASWQNFQLVTQLNAYVGFIAVAETIALIAGQFDLSVGAIAGLASVITAYLPAHHIANVWVTVLIVLVVGMAVGAVNGLIVVYGHINAFIVTLGMSGALGGAALWISGGQTLYLNIAPQLTTAGTYRLGSLPIVVVYVVALVLIMWVLTSRTVLGREWYAVGSNKEASRLAGLKVGRLTIGAFACSGLVAALGGILSLAESGTADPNAGPGLLLPAFAAAFLGSAVLSDGRFWVVGAAIAAFLVVFAGNGLTIAGVNVAVSPVFNSIVLVGAVGLTQLLRSQRGGRTSG